MVPLFCSIQGSIIVKSEDVGSGLAVPLSQFKVSPRIIQTIAGVVGIKYPSCERSLGCLSTMVVWFIVCILPDER